MCICIIIKISFHTTPIHNRIQPHTTIHQNIHNNSQICPPHKHTQPPTTPKTPKSQLFTPKTNYISITKFTKPFQNYPYSPQIHPLFKLSSIFVYRMNNRIFFTHIKSYPKHKNRSKALPEPDTLHHTAYHTTIHHNHIIILHSHLTI